MTDALEKTPRVEPPASGADYTKLVDAACVLVRNTNDKLLQFYWDLGGIVQKATGGSKDGPRSVPAFLEHMQQHAPGKITLGKDSLYNALSVRNSLTQAGLKEAQTAGITLRNLLEVCTKSTPPEVRESTIKRVASGEVPPTAMGEEARRQMAASGAGAAAKGAVKGARKPADDAKRAATIKVMRMPDMLADVTEKIEGYADALAVLCGEVTDEDEIDKIQNAVRSADDYMDNLNTKFQAELAKGRKAMDKTITTLSRAERAGKKK